MRKEEPDDDDVFDVGDGAAEDEEEDFEVVVSGDDVRDKSYPAYAEPWYQDYRVLIVGAVVGFALGVLIGVAWFPDETIVLRRRYSADIDTRIPFCVLMGLFGAVGGCGMGSWIEDVTTGRKRWWQK